MKMSRISPLAPLTALAAQLAVIPAGAAAQESPPLQTGSWVLDTTAHLGSGDVRPYLSHYDAARCPRPLHTRKTHSCLSH